MSYKIEGQILGFESVKEVEIHKIDDMFFTMQDVDNENISFTIVNPYMLREYSFDITPDIKELLEIHENSSLSAYNIVVIQKPLEDSNINFLAPIIINNDNNKIAQIILDAKRHPDYGMTETIKSFRKD